MKRIYFLLSLYLSVTTFTTFSQSLNKTLILVHGAGHGSWSWKKIIPLLENKGYKVIALDLPSSGNDTAKLANITLNDDIKSVIGAATITQGKVILLGHSSGGGVISQAGESLGPQKVDKLIYLDAFVPQDGESVISVAEKIEKYNSKSSALKPDTSTQEARLFSKDQKSFLWNPALVNQSLYHDCSQEDIAFAKAHLSWQAVATIATPLHLTGSMYGSIKKYYILCTQSKDLDKSSMVNNLQFEKVYKLPSSHSPFFSMPEKLVKILVDIH